MREHRGRVKQLEEQRVSDLVPAARPVIDEADIEAAVAVLRSGMVVQGPQVAAFEQEFSGLVQDRHCVAVNSGTSALHLALLALGFGPGDEVIVPSFTFAASANAIRLVGAEPVFVDIDPLTFTLSLDAVAAAVTPRTVAVMPVHLYGLPAAMPGLVELAQRHSLAVIEDAAQAHAARLGGTPVGAFGAMAAFSFYPTKNMHSLEGGMVVTGDEGHARTLRLLRNQGMEQRYANEVVGTNTRLTDVAAAIGRSQLSKLSTWTDQRRANAAEFDAAFGALAGITTPFVPAQAHHVYHQYTVRVGDSRDEFVQRLGSRGIGAGVYYPTPVHRLKPFLDASGAARYDLPATEEAARSVISLPVYPTLTQAERAKVIEAVTAVAQELW